MNAFDSAILQYLNQFAQRNRYLDNLVACVESNDLFKGGVVIALLWWLWFNRRNDDRAKEVIISTVIASLAALLVARTLAFLLPFRVRPLYNGQLGFTVPHGVNASILEEWSAFPSDHAVFFFALATGIALVSRKLGYWTLLYSFVAICLPRIYCGIHHPTDIIAGAVIGAGAAYAACSDGLRTKLTSRLLAWERERPDLFYASFFLVTYQMAILFYNIRDVGHRLSAFLG